MFALHLWLSTLWLWCCQAWASFCLLWLMFVLYLRYGNFLSSLGKFVAFYLKFFSTFSLSFLCDIPFTHLCNDHVCIQYPVIFYCHLTSPQDSVFYFCIFCLVFTSVLSINLKNLFLFIMSFQFYCTITYLLKLSQF